MCPGDMDAPAVALHILTKSKMAFYEERAITLEAMR